MFFVIVRLVTGIIKYFIGKSQDPVKLIDGMIDATTSQTITQGFGGKTIYRSTNEETGIEFTWAVSLYIKDQVTTGTGSTTKPYYSHIFSKGSISKFENDDDNARTAIKTINQAPGLYLDNNANAFIIKMDSFTQTNTITVSSIPHNKWLNVIIRCKNTVIDVYINGQLVNSTVLPGVPKQNYGNIYVCNNNGFIGNLSNLLYYRHALSINEIQASMTNSVDLTSSTAGITSTKTDYLGFKWYGI